MAGAIAVSIVDRTRSGGSRPTREEGLEARPRGGGPTGGGGRRSLGSGVTLTARPRTAGPTSGAGRLAHSGFRAPRRLHAPRGALQPAAPNWSFRDRTPSRANPGKDTAGAAAPRSGWQWAGRREYHAPRRGGPSRPSSATGRGGRTARRRGFVRPPAASGGRPWPRVRNAAAASRRSPSRTSRRPPLRARHSRRRRANRRHHPPRTRSSRTRAPRVARVPTGPRPGCLPPEVGPGAAGPGAALATAVGIPIEVP